jgi:hypothetical protein
MTPETQQTIAELAADRIDRIPFRPTMKRVIKPRDDAQLSDVAYTDEDRAEFEGSKPCQS